MKKNIDKYNYYYNLIEERNKKFIETEIPIVPDKIYEIENYYNIVEVPVTGMSYRNDIHKIDKPTKFDIERARSFWLLHTTPIREKIFINYKNKFGTGAYKYMDIEKGLKSLVSFNKKDLIVEADKRKKLYELKEGYERCSYCSKTYPKEKAIYGTIIVRSINKFGAKCIAEETNSYCSTDCNFHDQCAHEG